MDINKLSPYIRVALDSIIKPPWHLAERVIFDYELLYLKEGEALVTIEEEQYHGRPGDIFLFKPKQRHSIQMVNDQVFRQPHIHFDFFYQADSPQVKVSFKPLDQMKEEEMRLFRKDYTGDFGVPLSGKLNLQRVDYFEKMLFEIIQEHQMKLPYWELNAKGLFIRLWTYIIREIYWNTNSMVYSSMELLNRIKDYLQYHVKRNVSLDELVGEFKMSKYHLIRLFKKAFGMTPIHYHQLLRIEKAKELIQFTDSSFSKISDELGYESINAFSRAFRNVESVPPSFYRKRR